jgi:hypothetical protein
MFDRIFYEESVQADVFDFVALPIVRGEQMIITLCSERCSTILLWKEELIKVMYAEAMASCYQGFHNGRFWIKITVRTSARVRVYPADAVLHADGFNVRGRGTNPSARTLGCVRADMGRPRGRTSLQGCHADDNGRTMAAGASVTWTHCSVLFKRYLG